MRRWGILAMAALLGGCAFGGDVSAGTKAVDVFHRQLNAGRFADIYAAATPAFQASTPAPRFEALLAAVHRKLGLFRSDKVTGWRVNMTTGGTFANLTVASSYTGGEAQEAFVYQLNGGRAALVGYQVNAEALILN